MANFVNPRTATQIKYESSLSTFTHASQLITMQKGRLCFHKVINNFIVVQMQYEHKSWTDHFFKRKFVSLCSMNSTLLTNQQKRECFSPYQYVKMYKAQDFKTRMLQYLILFGTVYEFRHKRYSRILKQNVVLILPDYHSFCYLKELP